MNHENAYNQLKKAVSTLNEPAFKELTQELDKGLETSKKIKNGLPKNHKEKGE